MEVLPIIQSCDGCGACCMGLDTPPFHEYERPFVPAELLAEMTRAEEGIEFYDQNGGPCLWFDPATKKCRHYEYRPIACEDFERGDLLCRLARQDLGIS